MSHEDGYGGYEDEPTRRVGGTGQTRTRLPEPTGDPYGGPRRPPAPPAAWSRWSASSYC